MKLFVEGIEEINDALAKLVLQVELFTLGNLLSTLHQIRRALIDILKEILGGSFQQQDLVVMVTVMRQVAALFADQLIMEAAVCHVCSPVVRTKILLEARPWMLLIRLSLLASIELVVGKS